MNKNLADLIATLEAAIDREEIVEEIAGNFSTRNKSISFDYYIESAPYHGWLKVEITYSLSVSERAIYDPEGLTPPEYELTECAYTQEELRITWYADDSDEGQDLTYYIKIDQYDIENRLRDYYTE